MKVIWHDVECGGYRADLALWENLARRSDGPILELGCGTGRVGLHLARRGYSVTGLDADAGLLGALEERAAGVTVATRLADARAFELGSQFGLVLAPMALVQLFACAKERGSCLRCIATHLRPGAVAALAISEQLPRAGGTGTPLADVGELNGWLYKSLPVDPGPRTGAIELRRLRQTISPVGRIRDELASEWLQPLCSEALEQEGVAAGLRPAGRAQIPATDAHLGSAVVLLRREP